MPAKTFQRPFPGSPYDIWQQPKSTPEWKTIDAGTLEYVTDQVVHFLQKAADAAYAAKLQGNIRRWVERCRFQAASEPPDLVREYVQILSPAVSPHRLAHGWGFELRLCVDVQCAHGRLEGILYYPDQGLSQTRIDILFPATSIALPRMKLPRPARVLLRRYAIPTIWLDAPRQPEDILVELIVQVLGYIFADGDQAARFFPVFQAYVIKRLWPHRSRLSKEDRDSVIFEVFHHVCRNYRPVSSGKVWWRYLKRVLHGKICDSSCREEVRWEWTERRTSKSAPSAAPKNASKADRYLDFDFGLTPSALARESMSVQEAAKLLGIRPSSIYKKIREGTIRSERVKGRTMLQCQPIQQLLESMRAKEKIRQDAQMLAENRGIELKSAMRRLQREKRNRDKTIADAEDTSQATS